IDESRETTGFGIWDSGFGPRRSGFGTWRIPDIARIPNPESRIPTRVANARRTRRRSGISGAAVQRVPVADRSGLRSGRAADVSQTDGRVARAGRLHRVHPAAG